LTIRQQYYYYDPEGVTREINMEEVFSNKELEKVNNNRNVEIKRLVDNGFTPINNLEYSLIAEKLGLPLSESPNSFYKAMPELRNAKIIPDPLPDYPEVTVGSRVTLEFIDYKDQETFLITGLFEKYDDDLSTARITSCIGKAILGAKEGEVVSYILNDETKGNKTVNHVRILALEQLQPI
jgi:hypothetical protein